MKLFFLLIFLPLLGVQAESCHQLMNELMVIKSNHHYRGHRIIPPVKGSSYDNNEDNEGYFTVLGTLQRGTDPKVNYIIDELAKEGGDVVIMRGNGSELSAFTLNENGKPFIALDIAHGDNYATLHHEFEHVKDWIQLKRRLLIRGFSEEEANEFFFTAIRSPRYIWKTEVNAVKAELESNQMPITDPNYIKRKVYPEIAAIVTGLNNYWKSTRATENYYFLMEKVLWKASLLMIAQEKALGTYTKPYHHHLPFYFIERDGLGKFIKKIGLDTYDGEFDFLLELTIKKMARELPH